MKHKIVMAEKNVNDYRFQKGVLSVERGGITHYVLSIMPMNRSAISSAQWLYRNRKVVSKDVIKTFRKTKDGRRLLIKYKIRLQKV